MGDQERMWNNRFNVTDSKNNNDSHPFYREYFDKKPKEHSTHFRVKFAGSINELPGITQLTSKENQKVKDFKGTFYADQPHQNKWKMMQETRMPLKKGQSSAFPSVKKHVEMTKGWHNEFCVMSSSANDTRYKSQREYFDRPLMYKSGEASCKSSAVKPMEVYHRITPVRSIQQSINLIRALKTEQREILDKARPKSVFQTIAGTSDSYGSIPNLRAS